MDYAWHTKKVHDIFGIFHSGYEWIIIILVASSIVVVEEIRKFIYRHTNNNL